MKMHIFWWKQKQRGLFKKYGSQPVSFCVLNTLMIPCRNTHSVIAHYRFLVSEHFSTLIPVCKPFLCTHKDKHPTCCFRQNSTSFCYLCGFSSWSRAYTKTQNILECYTPSLLLNIYQQNRSPVRSGILVTLSLHFSACLCCWLKPLAELQTCQTEFSKHSHSCWQSAANIPAQGGMKWSWTPSHLLQHVLIIEVDCIFYRNRNSWLSFIIRMPQSLVDDVVVSLGRPDRWRTSVLARSDEQ